MKTNDSWGKVKNWYSNLVGMKGHFYHRTVIIPNTLRLLNLSTDDRLLDMGCGQGILARSIPKIGTYLGADISKELIDAARNMDRVKTHRYIVADVSKKLNFRPGSFDKAAIILALQNIKNQFGVIRNAAELVKTGGKIVIVLNHPAFRIPKHSDWQVDRIKKIQFRKIDRYMTPLSIPIDSSPFDHRDNQQTWSYHYPLSAYSELLADNGFVIEKMEEWISPKKSEGGMARVEDAARAEFPLFLAIVGRKI